MKQEPEVPKEVKLILAKMTGIPIIFPEGIAGHRSKDWYLMPPIDSVNMVLSSDGEEEFMATNPRNVDHNYCVTNEFVEEDSEFLAILLKGDDDMKVLINAPLVLNQNGAHCKQIFLPECEVFSANQYLAKRLADT